jgi:hypothetical protein
VLKPCGSGEGGITAEIYLWHSCDFFSLHHLSISVSHSELQFGRRGCSGIVKCFIGTSRHGVSGRIRRGDFWNSELTGSWFALTVIRNYFIAEL